MFLVRFLILVLRIVTINFFLLGFIFKPKWKKARKKVRGKRWDYHGYLLYRTTPKSFSPKQVEAWLRDTFPWYSPTDMKVALSILKSGRRLYFWVTVEEYHAISNRTNRPSNLAISIEKQWYCCEDGGNWVDHCSCYPKEGAEIKLPVPPTKSADVELAIEKGGK